MSQVGPIPEATVEKYAALGQQAVELVVVTLVLVVVGRVLVEPAVAWLLERSRLEHTVARALRKVLRATVLVVALAVGAGAAGLEGALAGSALLVTVGSLAVGFAARDVLANFVSGVFLVQDPELNVGDLIEYDDTVGVIQDIGFRVTRVRTADNATVVVPNTDLTTNPITNRTVNDPIGISYEFGIGYDDDVADAIRVIREAAADLEAVLSDPEPTIRVDDLTDTSVVVLARVWIDFDDRDDRGAIRSAFVRHVHERCREAGIDLSTTSHHDLSGELAVDSSDDPGDGAPAAGEA